MSKEKDKPVCGLVMPISAMEDCDESHWSEVMSILSTAIKDADFHPNMVSNADEVGLIHKRIIQNLYDNPIVVCDVSCKNPNVMFELGLRLAFDRPTIIIKDDKTAYSFDTSVIEHLVYPRDLRFAQIEIFQKNLSEKITATYNKSRDDENYTTFLKHFGEFKVAKLDKVEVTPQELIIEEISILRNMVANVHTEIKSIKDRNSPNYHPGALSLLGAHPKNLSSLISDRTFSNAVAQQIAQGKIVAYDDNGEPIAVAKDNAAGKNS